MRTQLLLFALVISFVVGCDKTVEKPNITSIKNTKWKLTKIIDNNSHKITLPPADTKDVELVLRGNGKVILTNLCNYSHGTYKLNKDYSISFIELSPGTEIYCEPIADLEDELIRGLHNARKYSIVDSQLKIESDNKSLFFNYIDKYDVNIGKVLFATNAHMLNCMFEIDVFIENDKVGVVKEGSQYQDSDCHCVEDNQHIGIIHSL